MITENNAWYNFQPCCYNCTHSWGSCKHMYISTYIPGSQVQLKTHFSGYLFSRSAQRVLGHLQEPEWKLTHLWVKGCKSNTSGGVTYTLTFTGLEQLLVSLCSPACMIGSMLHMGPPNTLAHLVPKRTYIVCSQER